MTRKKITITIDEKVLRKYKKNRDIRIIVDVDPVWIL